MPQLSYKQVFLIGLAVLGWAFVYLNQEFDLVHWEYRLAQYAQGKIPEGGELDFIVNKSVRFLLNDLFSLIFIYGLFKNANYLKVALLVMGFGFFILLPAYLFLAIRYQESGFNFLVFLHRITMNPWLMLLLIPAFYYRQTEKKTETPYKSSE